MADEHEEGEEEKGEKLEMLTEELKEEITEYFEIFDKDKDGQISSKELGTLLQTLKFNPTEREMKDFLQEFD